MVKHVCCKAIPKLRRSSWHTGISVLLRSTSIPNSSFKNIQASKSRNNTDPTQPLIYAWDSHSLSYCGFLCQLCCCTLLHCLSGSAFGLRVPRRFGPVARRRRANPCFSCLGHPVCRLQPDRCRALVVAPQTVEQGEVGAAEASVVAAFWSGKVISNDGPEQVLRTFLCQHHLPGAAAAPQQHSQTNIVKTVAPHGISVHVVLFLVFAGGQLVLRGGLWRRAAGTGMERPREWWPMTSEPRKVTCSLNVACEPELMFEADLRGLICLFHSSGRNLFETIRKLDAVQLHEKA